MAWWNSRTGARAGNEAPTRRERLVAVVEGLGLTVASVVAGIVAVLGISIALTSTGIPATDAVRLLQSRAIQVGFLGVALLSLAIRPSLRRSIRFATPTPRDLAWIIAVPLALAASGFLLEPLLAVVGIAPPAPAESQAVSGFRTRPTLWVVVLIGWFAFAAPAEELLFRGVIQGRLREPFAPVPGILLAAVCFGLMHVPVAALSVGMEPASSFVETFVGGAIFGVAYERTDNLVVPAVAHAGLWTAGLVV